MRTTTVAGRTWHYSHYLGRQTSEHNESQFGSTGGYMYPMDVTFGDGDVLFAVSRGWGYGLKGYIGDIGCRIGKTTIDEHHLGDFSRAGLTWPVGLAVAADGNVYCSDEYECSISVFDPEATFPFPQGKPGEEALSAWGVKGAAPGQLSGPSGIVFDSRDNLYVVDSRNDRVQLFTRDGQLLDGWGRSGAREGEFARPWGITIDTQGDVYVADWGNNRVQKFSPEGRYLMSFGGAQRGAGSLDHPAGVAVDSDGDVYVTDWGNGRVQIYEADGEVLATLHGDMYELSKAGKYLLNRDADFIKIINRSENVMPVAQAFLRPTGIAIDEEDRIVVADGRGRLTVYLKDNEYVEPPT
ncbi:MAG: NHL repeat-containing protein [SAR202 cluster bacterium]|nr:NHL repeat-containing protein [SAR202 cluster bacterium]